jgi:putative holliday junction resolvase
MGKLLAIDYGRARTGLAISDEEKVIAFKYLTLHEKDNDLKLNKIREIVEKEEIELMVIGIPLGALGQPTAISKEIEEFAEKLETSTSLQIVKWNEVMTSELAKKNKENIKYKKGDLDSESARIILQEYMDYSKYNI